MELDRAVGESLRELRKERGLSQEALALEAGVERNYISLIELGRNSPSIRMLFKLCKALSVSPQQMLARVESLVQAGTKKRQSKK